MISVNNNLHRLLVLPFTVWPIYINPPLVSSWFSSDILLLTSDCTPIAHSPDDLYFTLITVNVIINNQECAILMTYFWLHAHKCRSHVTFECFHPISNVIVTFHDSTYEFSVSDRFDCNAGLFHRARGLGTSLSGDWAGALLGVHWRRLQSLIFLNHRQRFLSVQRKATNFWEFRVIFKCALALVKTTNELNLQERR